MGVQKLHGQKLAGAPNKIRIKKNDTVKVITGKDRGKLGRVLEVDHTRGRLTVEGVMIMKKHTKPNPQRQIKGGIAESEGTIHVSNVMIVTADGTPTRVGTKEEKVGNKVKRTRIARKTGEVLDKKG
jgi:large subunit ribosomal protein L24